MGHMQCAKAEVLSKVLKTFFWKNNFDLKFWLKSAWNFSHPYKMLWKFFVPLQNLLKIFHTPTHHTPPRHPDLKMAGPISISQFISHRLFAAPVYQIFGKFPTPLLLKNLRLSGTEK